MQANPSPVQGRSPDPHASFEQACEPFTHAREVSDLFPGGVEMRLDPDANPDLLGGSPTFETQDSRRSRVPAAVTRGAGELGVAGPAA